MRARRRPLSGSFSTRASRTRSAKCTTGPPSWTGWSRSVSAASPSPRPPPRASGREWTASTQSIASTSLTRRGTSISPLKSSARCAFWTVPAWCIAPWVACSHNRKRSGARRTSTRCRGSRSLTRWIARVRTSSRCTNRCAAASRPTRFRCRCRLVPKKDSRAWST